MQSNQDRKTKMKKTTPRRTATPSSSSLDTIRLTIVVTLLAVVSGCGPMTTEPVPDIPQTVEYETVRIEYGDDDLIGGGSGVVRQALVGDPSVLARATKDTIRGTNAIIRDHFRLVDAITSFPPTAHDGNVWVWESRRERPDGLDYLRFAIEELGEDEYRYVLTGGLSEETAQDLFAGEFTSFGRRDGRQEGFGRLFLDFDAVGAADPEAEVSEGVVVIAFRSANYVRQVRTAFYEVVHRDNLPTSAIYDYTQFPSGAGTFTFFSRADFLEDGEPLEFLSIRAGWRADLAGRAVSRISQGSLQINEVIFRECWDSSAGTLYADSQPDFPNYEDGVETDCPELQRPFEDTPPVFRDPGDSEPDVPGPHPEEIDPND